MDTTPLWTLIPLAIALVLALFISGRSHTWSDPAFKSVQTMGDVKDSKTEDHSTLIDFKSRALIFFSTYYWEILLIGFSLILAIYLWLSAPVQLTGKVAIDPNQPGRPFYFLHWIRDYLSQYYNQIASASNFFSGLAALGLTITAVIRRSSAKLQFSLLFILMSLAGSAQWMISSEKQFVTGVILYSIAVLGFFLWSTLYKKSIDTNLDEPNPIPFRWEVTLVILTLGLATFGRIYALKSIPYGIEGDEAKWTAEVVSLGIRGEPDLIGMYHRDALPTSFYMQTLFHKILGPSLITARFEVAFFSILATLIFYLFLRQITVVPLALLAAWFLSASIFDISASRLAHVESHVKLWPILTLALLIWSIRMKRWQAYAITGIALAISLMTYDTVWPIGLVVLFLAAYEAWQNKDELAEASRNLVALFTPSLLAAPVLIPYIASRMSYYNLNNRESDLASLWGYFSDVLFSWYVSTFSDFLYNRIGPLLNAFLLPWMTFGLIVALTNSRRRLSFWTLVWALLFIIPAPTITHSPFGRIYYPALPAVYILVAIGMYIFGRESLRALGNGFRPLVITLSLLILVWVPLFNLFIYFNEVRDDNERQIRREAAELAGDAASPDTLIILATVPQFNEPLNNETQMIELFMLDKLSNEQIADSYLYLALEDVLPSLQNLSTRSNLSIILDKFTENKRQQRNDLTEALHSCYPQAVWVEGTFFDRVDINKDALSSATCVSAKLSVNFTAGNKIYWELQQGTASSISLSCESKRIFHEPMEAETLPLPAGWRTETAIAHGWAGDGFIMDNFGSNSVSFNLTLPEEKPVYIWVRHYQRVLDNSPAQITILDQTHIFSRIKEEQINQWIWERVGPFNVPSGPNIITLDRPYVDDPQQFMAIFIDTIIITANPDFSPLEDHEPEIQTQSFNFGQEQSRGELSTEFEPGSYRCFAEAFSQQSLVDAFGHMPVKSNTINFVIAP